MSSRLKDARRQTLWLAWLRREFLLLDTWDYIPTHEWVSYMIEEDLVPKLAEMGYNFLYTPHEMTQKILNRLFHLERDYLKGLPPRIYTYTQGRTEDYDHFFTVKCNDRFWSQFAWTHRIEWFADDDYFATRVWIELPIWVAQCIDFNNSSVTADLNTLLGYVTAADEDDSYAVVGSVAKAPVDPYVQDYYAGK
jgi:hypothetical protein